MLMARVYQPTGAGPFPTVLDLHGGAWNAKDRHAEEPMDRALAASGVLVVAIDMTLAPEAPYPACVQDANYGVRWLKSKAPSWNGDPSKIGVYGSSSGGHVAELLAMRPRDPRYNAIPLPEAPKRRRDGRLRRRCARRSATPFARFQNAEKRSATRMVKNNKTFFKPVGDDPRKQPAGDPRAPREGQPGADADHAGRARRQRAAPVQEKFAATYKAAGGDIQFELFEGGEHEWVAKPGPQTDRAREMVKAFIAKQLGARASN